MYIKAYDAARIINPITVELFCYDTDQHGSVGIDGYHWEMSFYRQSEKMKCIEGWQGEDRWRYGKFKGIIQFAERFIPKNLGSAQMNFYDDVDEKEK